MTKEDVIKQFTNLKGVGKTKAELLYDNGFTSLEKLSKATSKDLIKIQGITEKNAIDIITQLKTEKTEETTKTAEKKPTTKPKTSEPPKEKTAPTKPKEVAEPVEIIEETEGGYLVKQKPTLSKNLKHQLTIRKQIKKRTPEFLREEWFRYKRIPKNWRKPDGITSKMRRNYKYRPSMARVGFRGPKNTRALHPSGFTEIMVYKPSDLEHINPETQAARIGGTVGTKKRVEIAKKAEELKIRVLNMKV